MKFILKITSDEAKQLSRHIYQSYLSFVKNHSEVARYIDISYEPKEQKKALLDVFKSNASEEIKSEVKKILIKLEIFVDGTKGSKAFISDETDGKFIIDFQFLDQKFLSEYIKSSSNRLPERLRAIIFPAVSKFLKSNTKPKNVPRISAPVVSSASSSSNMSDITSSSYSGFRVSIPPSKFRQAIRSGNEEVFKKSSWQFLRSYNYEGLLSYLEESDALNWAINSNQNGFADDIIDLYEACHYMGIINTMDKLTTTIKDKNLLFKAIKNGDSDLTSRMISAIYTGDHLVDSNNISKLLSSCDDLGKPPIYYAILSNNEKILKEVLLSYLVYEDEKSQLVNDLVNSGIISSDLPRKIRISIMETICQQNDPLSLAKSLIRYSNFSLANAGEIDDKILGESLIEALESNDYEELKKIINYYKERGSDGLRLLYRDCQKFNSSGMNALMLAIATKNPLIIKELNEALWPPPNQNLDFYQNYVKEIRTIINQANIECDNALAWSIELKNLDAIKIITNFYHFLARLEVIVEQWDNKLKEVQFKDEEFDLSGLEQLNDHYQDDIKALIDFESNDNISVLEKIESNNSENKLTIQKSIMKVLALEDSQGVNIISKALKSNDEAIVNHFINLCLAVDPENSDLIKFLQEKEGEIPGIAPVAPGARVAFGAQIDGSSTSIQ